MFASHKTNGSANAYIYTNTWKYQMKNAHELVWKYLNIVWLFDRLAKLRTALRHWHIIQTEQEVEKNQ